MPLDSDEVYHRERGSGKGPRPSADWVTQTRLAAHSVPSSADPPGGPWDTVYGKVLTFNDPEIRLPALDPPEEFQPGRPSMYYRVLLRMKEPAWVYM